jgi:hypothetical protein
LLAAIGAYWSVRLADEIFLSWALFLFGGAIVYALILPYKRASLIEDDWGLSARAKALRIVLGSTPLYVLPAIVILLDDSLAESLPTFRYQIQSFQFPDAFGTFFALVLWLFIGGLLASILTGSMYIKTLLHGFGFGDDEIDLAMNYARDQSVVVEVGFSFVIVFSALYVSAAASRPVGSDIAIQYFSAAFLLIVLLIFYGHFVITFTPSLCKKRPTTVLKYFLFFSTIEAAIDPLIGVPFAIAALAGLHFMSEEGRSRTSYQEFLSKKQNEELERRLKQEIEKLEQDWWSYLFYKLYPRVEQILAVLVMISLFSMLVLSRFGYQIGLLEFIVFLIVFSGVYYGMPRIYFYWKAFRNEIGDLEKKIEEKRSEGAFDLI